MNTVHKTSASLWQSVAEFSKQSSAHFLTVLFFFGLWKFMDITHSRSRPWIIIHCKSSLQPQATCMWIASYMDNICVHPVTKTMRWCTCSYCEVPNCMVYALNNRDALASKDSERCTDDTFGAPSLVQTVQAKFCTASRAFVSLVTMRVQNGDCVFKHG